MKFSIMYIFYPSKKWKDERFGLLKKKKIYAIDKIDEKIDRLQQRTYFQE